MLSGCGSSHSRRHFDSTKYSQFPDLYTPDLGTTWTDNSWEIDPYDWEKEKEKEKERLARELKENMTLIDFETNLNFPEIKPITEIDIKKMIEQEEFEKNILKFNSPAENALALIKASKQNTIHPILPPGLNAPLGINRVNSNKYIPNYPILNPEKCDELLGDRLGINRFKQDYPIINIPKFNKPLVINRPNLNKFNLIKPLVTMPKFNLIKPVATIPNFNKPVILPGFQKPDFKLNTPPIIFK
jgi:hypothetical protein